MFSMLVFLSLILASANAQKVVSFPIQKHQSPALFKRGTYSASVENDLKYYSYFINVGVGTPPQMVSLGLDTGSSATWMFAPGGCVDSTSLDDICIGSTFELNDSSTAELLNEPFFAQYGTANSEVRGEFFKDTLIISSATVTNFQMAVATQAAQLNAGILGLGFSTEDYTPYSDDPRYPNLPDVLVSEGLINTRAYSVWLDDYEAPTGTILFGGYDTKKFQDFLFPLGIQPDPVTNEYTSLSVGLTGISLSYDGATHQLTPDNFYAFSVLDTGSGLTLLPPDIYEMLAQHFGVTLVDNLPLVDCNIGADSTGTLNFEFDGVPVVKVPFSELAISYGNNPTCLFGVEATPEGLPVILGDTFLRSAYVLYDLDNLKISLGQTIFNATGSHIVEIGPSFDGMASPGSGSMLPVTQTAESMSFTSSAATQAPSSSESSVMTTANRNAGGSTQSSTQASTQVSTSPAAASTGAASHTTSEYIWSYVLVSFSIAIAVSVVS